MSPSLGQTAVEARQSQVNEQLGRLRAAIEAVDNACLALEKRLDSVLVTVPPEPPSANKVPSNPIAIRPPVALADELSSLASRLENIGVGLQAMRERCEL
jgi:hypothetical protein